MDFFNDLGKKLGNTAKTVTKKSEELVETTKLNLSIGNEEDKIKKLLMEIGSEIYGRYSEGELLDEFLSSKCSQIKELTDKIDSLKEKIKNLKGRRTCSKCGADIKEGISFCPACGNKTDN